MPARRQGHPSGTVDSKLATGSPAKVRDNQRGVVPNSPEGCSHPRPYPIVVGAVNVSRHAKVPDFHHQAVPHQAVAGGQVPVDEVLGGQIDHARGDLRGDLQHFAQGQLAKGLAVPIVQHLGIRPV